MTWIICSFISIFSLYQTGCGDLDNRPKIRDDLPPLKKKLYMDEALSKTSKCQMNWINCDQKNLTFFLFYSLKKNLDSSIISWSW